MDKRAKNRIPATDETQELLNGFKAGLSSTYDEAIRFALYLITKSGESTYDAGQRLKKRFQEFEESEPEAA